jgi:small subunit ribosomal protein S16
MKSMGRKHRPFFRICAIDGRKPRDGRVLEQLGTYDPLVPEADARVLLNGERVKYWLSVGAQPTEKVGTLIKKYGADGTHAQQQQQARDRLAMPKIVPDPGPPAEIKSKQEPAAEAPAEEPAAE